MTNPVTNTFSETDLYGDNRGFWEFAKDLFFAPW